MQRPPLLANEQERLKALLEYQVLDTLPEEDYDQITRIASQICNTPISLITLIDEDRQWFKSRYGLEVSETPRELAYCAHSIATPGQPLIVENASEDERFFDNPLATGEPHVQFYAGIPLVNPAGYALGSLCVIDRQARKLMPEQLSALQALAKQVVNLLELRKSIQLLARNEQLLLAANRNLKEFAYLVSHDIKAPLRNMKQMAEIVLEDHGPQLNKDGQKWLNLIHESASDAIILVDGVLSYSKSTHRIDESATNVNLNEFLPELVRKVQGNVEVDISFPSDLPLIRTSEIALQQIIVNLLSNAIKYQDKKPGWVRIGIFPAENSIRFQVEDNGRGIPEQELDKIFDLFYRIDKKDGHQLHSSGVGLAIVKKLVAHLGGAIQVSSKAGEGSLFEFSIELSQ